MAATARCVSPRHMNGRCRELQQSLPRSRATHRHHVTPLPCALFANAAAHRRCPRAVADAPRCRRHRVVAAVMSLSGSRELSRLLRRRNNRRPHHRYHRHAPEVAAD
ncbi:hypothetical protein Dimus_007735, partial [Dionaea muscipula]